MSEVIISLTDIPQERIMSVLDLYITNSIHTINTDQYKVFEIEMKSKQVNKYANGMDRILGQPYITFNFYDLKIKLSRAEQEDIT
jgi:hypothetical protein